MDQPTKTANSIRSLFTRAKANEGTRIPLDGGNWIDVRGIDSDVVQKAVADHARAQLAIKAARKKAGEPEGEAIALYDDPDVLAAMVLGWSFDEPCTVEIVKELLAEAPYLRTDITNAAFERARFLPQDVKPSSDTPKPNSD